MNNQQIIIEALKKLDPTNPNHWTEDGLPRIETVKLLSGNQKLTREEVTQAAPGFSIANTVIGGSTAPATAPAVIAPVTQAQAPLTTENATPPSAQTNEPPKEDEVFEGEVLVDFQANVDAAKELVEEKRAALEAAKAELDKANKALDTALDEQIESGTKETNHDVLSGYLEAQKNHYQNRADRMDALRKSGITAKELRDIIPRKAPIDEAMARRNARGTSRPGS